ncbi:Piso0_001606 [Millerozyma farinosa CBS 7064]|uniref:Piso0_001606 protein n=1 Tax=Pichia sorbitophila (strain ATCC MYA-4447 / BCRC 22081 / CBS 7064 / NBRC 10061 / NRRL Y-12695) TaxID=559304 RepID=G8YNL6_PICSO|nr:Piso0_001606 [Millerozyma farinosa CBS 7064]
MENLKEMNNENIPLRDWSTVSRQHPRSKSVATTKNYTSPDLSADNNASEKELTIISRTRPLHNSLSRVLQKPLAQADPEKYYNLEDKEHAERDESVEQVAFNDGKKLSNVNAANDGVTTASELLVPKIKHLNLQREPSDATTSLSENDVFFETSPVLASVQQMSSIYDHFEMGELDGFRDAVSPKYDSRGNLLPVPKFYPTLLSERFYPVVQVTIRPHMSKPLANADCSLDLSFLERNSNAVLHAAPFCNMYEDSTENISEESALLNILTYEITKSEPADNSSKPSRFRKVIGSLKSFFKSSLSNEEYNEKFPWAKFIPQEELEEDSSQRRSLLDHNIIEELDQNPDNGIAFMNNSSDNFK